VSGYRYGGTGKSMSEEEVAERLKATRAEAAARVNGTPGPSPALATSREARGAVPAPALIQGHVEPDGTPPPALKGAVKVTEFPERSKYPFRQIASDGGIWEIDPAVFKVTPGAVVQAARKWAEGRSLAVKLITDDGLVYVQFKAGGE
jgi:hypothetical protein